MVYATCVSSFCCGLAVALVCVFGTAAPQRVQDRDLPKSPTLNQTADGYRGIWYMNQPSNDEYVYKYSGGLGTYCAKHRPFAIYCPQVNKTFFCYGGASKRSDRELLHMVSCFDHETKSVPRPTILLNKQTSDAHDNPVISIDDEGYVWIFSTSHGRARPSYIHRSLKPFDVSEFERIDANRRLAADGEEQKPITNFSYMQVWHVPQAGFQAFFTRYSYPVARTICFMNSEDGIEWSHWQRIAAIEQGHYQISEARSDKIATMFNMHPNNKGLNYRTNLYYLQSLDQGQTWQTVDGKPLELPLTEANNPALIRDYQTEQKNVYLKDLRFDSAGNPVLLYITSLGYESGPANGPRVWTIATWRNTGWKFFPVTESDNNYDFGELQLVDDDHWRLIAPTAIGPQPFNPGGEIAMWETTDAGETWQQKLQMTKHSPHNHTYVRPVRTHGGKAGQSPNPDFVALWADGHGRRPSESRLYFSNTDGEVFQLPPIMDSESAKPQKIELVD